jgi:hypothetical protein
MYFGKNRYAAIVLGAVLAAMFWSPNFCGGA